MIDLHYWPTPNGHKITMMLEETGLDYAIHAVDIGKGEQFQPDFLKIAPNNRMPAIVDQAPSVGDAPIAVFESGAILLYLAEKTGRFGGDDLRQRTEITQWLMWQMGGLGPMLGQNHHFNIYAPEKIPYAMDRYMREAKRLYGVLDAHLEGREYIAGDYSIADIACFPWIMTHKAQGLTLDDYPNVKRWYALLRARPALQAGLAVGKQERQPMDEQARKIMFGVDKPAHAQQQ